MKQIIYILLLSLCVYTCSSDDSNNNEGDYLIFGHFYGMCGGNGCVVTYKLTDDGLLEDTTKEYPGTNFNFIPMGQNEFEAVNDLMDYFPSELLNVNEDFIGCPDCADQGGVFIEYSKNGTTDNWRIDQYKNNVPDYLHAFMDKVNEKINLLDN